MTSTRGSISVNPSWCMRLLTASDSGLLSQWVITGSLSGASSLASGAFSRVASLSARSARASLGHAGTITNAMTLRAGLQRFSSSQTSRKRSRPLLRYSQRPLVMTINEFGSIFLPVRAEATDSILSRAALLAAGSLAAAGTKFFSKPLGVTTSGRRSSNCSHSLAVISLTVVNESAAWAAAFSSECLASMFSSRAIWSPL